MGTRPRQQPDGNSEPALFNPDHVPGTTHGILKVIIPCDLHNHSETIAVFSPLQTGVKPRYTVCGGI